MDAIYPAHEKPDHILLTPGGDMADSVNVSWRTVGAVKDNVIEYHMAMNSETFVKKAAVNKLTSPELSADRTISCFGASLTGLKPATTYMYRVGNTTTGQWSDYYTFTTAAEEEPFSFVYLGDVQTKPENFGAILNKIDNMYPGVSFYMLGGDLVYNGKLRNLWDMLLSDGRDVYSSKPIAPAMGNHDYNGSGNSGRDIFNCFFNTGPSKFASYSFTRGNAYFIVIESIRGISMQKKWLESELKQATSENYDFIIVMFHSSPYNTAKNRVNEKAQKYWVPLFDKYNVSLVLNGHDHNYMRTKKLYAGKPVAAERQGTLYVTANACETFYAPRMLDFAEVQIPDVMTYQLISIGRDEAQTPYLEYKALDFNDRLVDGFTLYASSAD